MNDNRKNTVIIKISSQIEKYFELALNNLELKEVQNIIGSSQTKVKTYY